MRNRTKAAFIIGGTIAAIVVFLSLQTRDHSTAAEQAFIETAPTVQYHPIVPADPMRPDPSLSLTSDGQ